MNSLKRSGSGVPPLCPTPKVGRVAPNAPWPVVPLGDLCVDVQYGSSAKTSEDPNGVPVLRMGNIQNGALSLDTLKYLPASHPEFPALLLQEGDLLFNRTNSAELVGKTAVYKGNPSPASFASYLIRLKVRPGVVPEYVSFCLNSPFGRSWIRSVVSQQVGQANVNGSKVKAFCIPVPPLPEQRRIVAEIEAQFTKLDAGVAALKRVQANLKRYRAAVLKAACEGCLVPTESARLKAEGRMLKAEDTGAGLLAQILSQRRENWTGRGKYSEPETADTARLPQLPVGWIWMSLDQLQVFMRNGISAKPDAEPGLAILRISAVRPLRVSLDEVRYLHPKSDEYADYELEEGDLLFTRYNGNPDFVGVCGAVPKLSFNVVHPDKLIRSKLVPRQVLPRFVAMMANVGSSREYLAKRVRTTAGQAGISGGDLKGLPIPLPPLAEQTRIVAEVERRLSVIDELETVVAANLKRATRLRQSLLQRAFIGDSVETKTKRQS